MNEVLKEIIVSYLPAIASVGGTTVAAIFIKKFVIGFQSNSCCISSCLNTLFSSSSLKIVCVFIFIHLLCR